MAVTELSDGSEKSSGPAIQQAAPSLTPGLLLNGVGPAVCEVLGIRSVSHRSALIELSRRPVVPPGSVSAAYAAIAGNWRRCRASQIGSRSAANWRWRVPQLRIAPQNRSPEVVLERAVVGACERLGRADWSNQVPVASGVSGGARERRRAIDLVHQQGPGWFEFIELKIASNTPLFAAFEIIGYACLWLLSREEVAACTSQLLAADRIEAKVLAPPKYYDRYALGALQRVLNEELAALGDSRGVRLSFAFESFSGDMPSAPFEDAAVLAIMDQRRPI